MKNLTIKNICNTTISSHIDRMQLLCEEGRIEDAESVYNEIRDWVIQKDDLKVLSLAYIGEHFEDS